MTYATRITLRDGLVILPAESEYDDAVALEEAGFYARRHGEVTMEIHDHEVIVRSTATPTMPCAECQQPLTLGFGTGERFMCPRCTRESLRDMATVSWPADTHVQHRDPEQTAPRALVH